MATTEKNTATKKKVTKKAAKKPAITNKAKIFGSGKKGIDEIQAKGLPDGTKLNCVVESDSKGNKSLRCTILN